MELFIKTAISFLKYFCNKYQRLKINTNALISIDQN